MSDCDASSLDIHASQKNNPDPHKYDLIHNCSQFICRCEVHFSIVETSSSGP